MRLALVTSVMLAAVGCTKASMADSRAGLLIVHPDGAAVLCTGGVAESLPPQCTLPRKIAVRGLRDQDIKGLGDPSGTAGGIRWYDGTRVNGHLTDNAMRATDAQRTSQ